MLVDQSAGTGSTVLNNRGLIIGAGTPANPVISVATNNATGSTDILNTGIIATNGFNPAGVAMNITGRDDFIVKLANATGQVALEAGAAIEIGWRREDCRALSG